VKKLIARRPRLVIRPTPPEATHPQQRAALDAVAAVKQARRGVRLAKLNSRMLVRQGRR
jgi:hypothetical protein